MTWKSFSITAAALTGVLGAFGANSALAEIIVVGNFSGEMVLVGDAGNTADDGGYGLGAVASPYLIGAYEITNSQYAAFLNTSLAGRSNAHGIYNPGMGTAPQGGISQSSSEGGFTYSVKADMGDKPVNFVSWFDAARFVNWISNGGLSESSLETGAYELNDETSAGIVLVNPGSTWFLPSQDQWYKAAYYKGGGLDAGCWTYATQSDTEPAQVTADASGNGASGNFGNSANFNKGADWNGLDGNVTTVGTNGGPSAYGAFDMSGNVLEWNDAVSDELRGVRGGGWNQKGLWMSSDTAASFDPTVESFNLGFRIASVPEPSAFALVGVVGAGALIWRRIRKRH